MSRTATALDTTSDARRSPSRAMLLLAALAYTAFVIYGSLVPLEFQALPWDEAVVRFRQIPFLRLGIGSRADWVANLLLFIPLAFLWTGVLALEQSRSIKLLASILVMAGAIVLSVGIEFTQLYFPQRTVSLNDLIAETLGGIIGVIVWWFAGPRFANWLSGWTRSRSHLEITQRLTLVYLFLLFAYSLLPLDLTISPVEVYHKFRDGKLNLIPFARLPANPVHALYELASDSLLWLVPALMWRWSGRTSSLRVWTGMAGAALLLECLQLFVYSRISDVTDIFTAALGAGLGVWVAGLVKKHSPSSHSTQGIMPLLLPLLLASVWTVLVIVVFWYPFEFRTDGTFLRERVGRFMTSVPFRAYYFGTEYRAATEVMHKLLFFIPLGAMLGWLVSRLPWMWRGYGALLSMVMMGAVAMVVVAGRLAQPEKSPDVMDPVLHWLGGGLGFAIVRILASRRMLAAHANKRVAPSPDSAHRNNRIKSHA